MTKEEACKLFVAMCMDERCRFKEQAVAFSGRAKEGFWQGTQQSYREVTMRLPNGDEYTMVITDYPGGYSLAPGPHEMTMEQYGELRKAWDYGIGNRSKAKVEDVRKLLGI